MSKSSPKALSALMLLLLFTTCKDRTSTVAPPPSPAPAAAEASNPESAPTPAADESQRTPVPPEFLHAAQELESAIASGDKHAIADLIDNEAFTSRVASSLRIKSTAKRDVIAHFRASQAFEELSELHISYHLLRVFNQFGKTHAIFRLVQPDGQLNYHDWILIRSTDAKIRGIDVFIAASGEYFSQSAHRIYLLMGVVGDNEGAYAVPENDAIYVSHTHQIGELGDAFNAHHFQTVIDLYQKLPQSLRKEKLFLLYQIVSLQQLKSQYPGEAEKAAAEYEKLFPGDPCIGIVTVNIPYQEKKYAAYYKIVDDIERWTGGDPYLQSSRGNVMLEEGKPDAPVQAEKIARCALTQEPNLILAHSLLVRALAFQEKYEDAVKEIEIFESLSHTSYRPDAITQMKNLTTSKPYLDYRAQHPIP